MASPRDLSIWQKPTLWADPGVAVPLAFSLLTRALTFCLIFKVGQRLLVTRARTWFASWFLAVVSYKTAAVSWGFLPLTSESSVPWA